jgi:electron transport complex protein RnfG
VIDREPSSLRLVSTLGVAGLTAGLVLVGVYVWARPLIERNQEERLQAAVRQVLPGTATTSRLLLEDGRLSPFDETEPRAAREELIIAGYREDGTVVGYAIPAEGPGFMDTIKLIYGYDPGRRVVIGMEVLESRETPGLGDKIITDEAFRDNFQALAVEPEIVPVKKGRKTDPNQVDCITGATISSESVVKILNRSVDRWGPLLEPLETAMIDDWDEPARERLSARPAAPSP